MQKENRFTALVIDQDDDDDDDDDHHQYRFHLIGAANQHSHYNGKLTFH